MTAQLDWDVDRVPGWFTRPLTPSEAGHQLGITSAAVKGLVRRGLIQGTKVNGFWLLDRSSVQAWPALREQRRRERADKARARTRALQQDQAERHARRAAERSIAPVDYRRNLQRHVDATPLLRQLELRGGWRAAGVEENSAAEMALQRAQTQGWLTEKAADWLTVKVLGLTPWDLWPEPASPITTGGPPLRRWPAARSRQSLGARRCQGTMTDSPAMDPVVTTALVKAAGEVGADAERQTGKLFTRVLGPAADEVGEALRRFTEQRLRNVGRIVDSADKKTDGAASGEVPPRVAHRLLDDGSYCDDDLMVEYLSGVMAGSRTPSGRDDRAVTWAGLISEMSVLEVRCHFLLYSAWAQLLRGRRDIDLWSTPIRETARLHLDLLAFVPVLVGDSEVNPADALSHALLGLQRRGLIADSIAWGGRDYVVYKDAAYDSVVVAELTLAGIELYGWALGVAGMKAPEFVTTDRRFVDPNLPTATRTAIPGFDLGELQPT